MTPPPAPTLRDRDFLNTAGSRAVGLLRLLAIAATSDHSHGPPSLQEIDAIRGLANDTCLDLGVAIEAVNESRKRRVS